MSRHRHLDASGARSTAPALTPLIIPPFASICAWQGYRTPRPSPTCLSDLAVVASARTPRPVIPSAAAALGQTPTTRPPVRSFILFSRSDIRVFLSSCSCARPQPSPASADTMSPTTSLRIIQHSCVWGAGADNQHRGRPLWWWRHHRWLWQHWGYDTSLSFERCERRVSLVDVVLGGLTALPWNAPGVFSKCLAPLSTLFQGFLCF